MSYRNVSSRLDRVRGEIADFKKHAKSKYGADSAEWPADVLWRYEHLKRRAADIQDLLIGEVAA